MEKWQPIVKKSGEYFTGEVSYCHQAPLFRFSPSAYDAKRFKTVRDARAKAKAIGGEAWFIDKLHGDVRREAP